MPRTLCKDGLMPNHDCAARVEARRARTTTTAPPLRGVARGPLRDAGAEFERLLREEVCTLGRRCGHFDSALRFLFIDLEPARGRGASLTTIGAAIVACAAHPTMPVDGLDGLIERFSAWIRAHQLRQERSLLELFAQSARSNADAGVEQIEAVTMRSVPEIVEAISATQRDIAFEQELLRGLVKELNRAQHVARGPQLVGGAS